MAEPNETTLNLNCGEISSTDFTVLALDPNQFDGVGDGVGCEG